MMKVIGLVLAACVVLPVSCGGSSAAPVDGPGACHQVEITVCDKAYTCVAPADRNTDFSDQYGTSLAECKGSLADNDCATAATDCPKVDAAKLSTCLSKTKAFTCADFIDPSVAQPEECMVDQLCGPAP